MTTTTTAQDIATGLRLIGRDRNGARVYVELDIKHHGPDVTTDGAPITKQTTDHRHLAEYDDISICGAVVPKHCRDAQSFGQCTDALDTLDPATLTITRDEVRDLRRLWQKRHLSGMRAHCIHQDAAAHIDREGISTYPGGWFTGKHWDRAIAEQTAKCPHGYRYGSQWLVDVIPDSDMQTARHLANRLRGLPKYHGN
jgi:hypothetical protein